MKTTWIFWTGKLHRKKHVGKTWIFWPTKMHQKSTWKQGGFFDIEITLKKTRGKNADFWTIEITSKKVCGKGVNFSISENTSKKYVEVTWKFEKIRPLTYRRNIHVESTSIRHGLPVGIHWSLLASVALPSPSSFLIVQRILFVELLLDLHLILFVYSNQLLLIYNDFWWTHNVINIQQYNLHLVLLLIF